MNILKSISTGDGVEPSVYILGLYESSVDLTVTKDGQEIIDKLSGVNVFGGTELVFKAIQVILRLTFALFLPFGPFTDMAMGSF